MLKTPITFDLSPHCLYCFPVESSLLLYLRSTASLLFEFERLRDFLSFRAAGDLDRRLSAGDRERRRAAGDRDLDLETDLSFFVEGDLALMFIVYNSPVSSTQNSGDCL